MAEKKQNRRNKNYDDDYNPRFRKQRKKVCLLCSDKNFELDYKNPEQLKKFINDKGKILPRRTTIYTKLIVYNEQKPLSNQRFFYL